MSLSSREFAMIKYVKIAYVLSSISEWLLLRNAAQIYAKYADEITCWN